MFLKDEPERVSAGQFPLLSSRGVEVADVAAMRVVGHRHEARGCLAEVSTDIT